MGAGYQWYWRRTGTASLGSRPTTICCARSSRSTGRKSALSTTAATAAQKGELTDGILDQLAKYERAKTARTTLQGKLQKVRQGKILAAAPRPRYGFRYNERRDGYEVGEETMPVVRRIFRLFGEEGASVHGARDALQR